MSKTSSDSTDLNPRMIKELKTTEAMIAMYCRAHHAPANTLCSSCSELMHYAEKRLLNCPFQENKPTCGKCTVHCYKPAMRETIRKVMRYAGPRMMLHHPILALRHLLDGCRKPPELRRKKKSHKPTTPTGPSGRSNT